MKKIIYILVIVMFAISVRKVNAYAEYKIGDEITYNDIKFYVIKDSGSDDDTVTMLKAEPLAVDEVNKYGGVGTANNHVNTCVGEHLPVYQKSYDDGSGYGGMAYYCSYVNKTTDYTVSDIKYVVDAWTNDKIDSSELIESRLITIEELTNNLGYINSIDTSKTIPSSNGITPNFVYNTKYSYHTMSSYNDSNNEHWCITNSGSLTHAGITGGCSAVRPVIVLNKNAIVDKYESIKDNNTDNKETIIDTTNKNETKSTVKVDNTYMSWTVIIIIIGFISTSISIFTLYILSNKKR